MLMDRPVVSVVCVVTDAHFPLVCSFLLFDAQVDCGLLLGGLLLGLVSSLELLLLRNLCLSLLLHLITLLWVLVETQLLRGGILKQRLVLFLFL